MRARVLVALAIIGAVSFGAGSAVAGANQLLRPNPPRVTVTPNNVMVNTRITVTGTGFPAKSALVIAECSLKDWIVPQPVCNESNQVTVTTTAKGAFTTGFTAGLCPRVGPVHPPVTSVTCYIGEPKPSGVDTIRLIGAAKLTVTYP